MNRRPRVPSPLPFAFTAWIACSGAPPAEPAPSAQPSAQPSAPPAATAQPVPANPAGDAAGPDGVPQAPTMAGVDWIAIPATEAWIGAQARDPSAPRYDVLAGPDDTPPARVKVAAFEIMRTEVPVAVWQQCEQAGRCTPRTSTFGEEAGETALRGITYAQAEQVCSFVSGRLPTGPEWEIAARADHDHRFAWGNGKICPVDASEMVGREDRERARLSRCDDVAAHVMRTFTDEDRKHVGTGLLLFTDADWDATCAAWRATPEAELRDAVVKKVDALLAAVPQSKDLPDCGTPRLNAVSAGPVSIPYKLVYMSGNVAEWTAEAGPKPGGAMRAARGGSFFSASALEYRLAARTFLPPDVTLQDVGVRCARGG